jgi:hypothetical protein
LFVKKKTLDAGIKLFHVNTTDEHSKIYSVLVCYFLVSDHSNN